MLYNLVYNKNMLARLIIFIHITLAIFAISHVILNKRSASSALNWILFIFIYPFFGIVAYFLFGINRVKKKVLKNTLKTKQLRLPNQEECPFANKNVPITKKHLQQIEKIVDKITFTPLLPGNAISLYKNGDEAYPAILTAMGQAKHSINLCSYIFDGHETCHPFLQALIQAKKRGVIVNVFIDGVGAFYSLPSMFKLLKKNNIRVHLFNPTLLPWKTQYLNLRNHKKIIVIDGKIGFTGGMNLSRFSIQANNPKNPIQDIHFKIEGPVVRHLQETFVLDWAYITNEELTTPEWFPTIKAAGNIPARGISDGPDDGSDQLRDTILGAISCSRSSITIQSPYFLPDSTLISALKSASRRGVKITIMIPEKNNFRLVQWAAMAQMWQILNWGEVYLGAAPFDHSKFMVVDDFWCFIGSANWDQRSLRLNYEFNLECYSTKLAKELNATFQEKKLIAKKIDLSFVDSRHLLIKLRDGLARLGKPLL